MKVIGMEPEEPVVSVCSVAVDTDESAMSFAV